MKDEEIPSPKKMLEVFDAYQETADDTPSGKMNLSDLAEGISLMLEQMKITRNVSLELKKTFHGSDDEFRKKATSMLGSKLKRIEKKILQMNPMSINFKLLGLPEKKGRVFFEIIANAEEAGKLPLNSPQRREINDKNIEKMGFLLEFIKSEHKKYEENVGKQFKNPGKKTMVLQLHIYIMGISPKIWRRILVKDNITFHRLHLIIQEAMGWDNYHLYNFEFGDIRLESEELAEGEYSYFEPSEKIKLCQLLGKENEKIDYLYDFGDCWKHEIKIEKILDFEKGNVYPLCIGGERNCPPEDSGSVEGYERLMKIRKNPKHKDYKWLIKEWLGEDYEPEYFDISKINRKLAKLR